MKNQLRKKYLEIRKQISIDSKVYAQQILAIIPKYSLIGIYYPLKSEINILQIIDSLPYSFALPIIKDRMLLFGEFDPIQSELKLNKFKVLEPINSKLCIPPFVIVPLLCFDPLTKHRLGYGGGFYDQTIYYYRQHYPATKFIGLAHNKLQCDNFPADENDQQLDFIVTETKIF